MARKNDNLDSLKAERMKLEAALDEIRKREREAENAVRDAGRPVLLAALDKIKIGPMERDIAKQIAEAIAQHGGKAVAVALAAISA